MRHWLLATLALSALGVAAALALAPSGQPASWAPGPTAARASATMPLMPAPAAVEPLAEPIRPREPVSENALSPALTPLEAQALMQVMAEQGDPRQPQRGGLAPRPRASATQLADPKAYAAFEDEQSRSQAQAWARGVEQIPAIRQAIAEAEASGSRSGAELDEARAALGQLEELQQHLQRQAPELLPAPPAE